MLGAKRLVAHAVFCCQRSASAFGGQRTGRLTVVSRNSIGGGRETFSTVILRGPADQTHAPRASRARAQCNPSKNRIRSAMARRLPDDGNDEALGRPIAQLRDENGAALLVAVRVYVEVLIDAQAFNVLSRESTDHRGASTKFDGVRRHSQRRPAEQEIVNDSDEQRAEAEREQRRDDHHRVAPLARPPVGKKRREQPGGDRQHYERDRVVAAVNSTRQAALPSSITRSACFLRRSQRNSHRRA